MSLNQYSIKLAQMRGGDRNVSIFNYMPNRINQESGQLELQLPFGNYIGPLTDVRRRWLDEKRRGTTITDDAARIHDIQYSNLGTLKAQNRINQQQLEQGVRQSDKQLVSAAKRNLISLRPFNGFHAAAAYTGIKGKMMLQDINAMSKSAFTTSNQNRPFMNENRPEAIILPPAGYLGTGGKKPKKHDRLKGLKKLLK